MNRESHPPPPFEILVVDDEAFVRETLSLYLESEGCRVHCADNGERALEIAAAEPIEAAIVDIRMPGMDGLTLLSELKRRHPDLEVLIATGFQSLETAVDAMRRGACDYITKPINDLESELLRFVRRAIERRRLRLHNRGLSHDLQSALHELGGMRGRQARIEEALEALEEFGRRSLRIDEPRQLVTIFGELLPRVVDIRGAAIFLDPTLKETTHIVGTITAPFPDPPVNGEGDQGAEAPRWQEDCGEDPEAADELWLPLGDPDAPCGWVLLRTDRGALPRIEERLAVRALADHFAATLAAFGDITSEPNPTL